MFESVEKQLIKKLENACDDLAPIECYLNRVFPSSDYENQYKNLVEGRAFQPRKDCEAYKISFPMDWEAEWCKEDRNWRMQLQGMVMFHPIMNFFDTYEDKRIVVDYFLQVISDWSLNYGDDPNDIVTTRMPESYAWYDMSVGFRALVIAFFINRISHFKISLLPSEVSSIAKIAFKHISHLRNEEVFSSNNHGMFQIQGLMSLIQMLGIEEYETEYKHALNKMEVLVFSQFDSKGVHLEHSPHYHFYALTTFDNVVCSGWYESKETIPRIVSLAHGKKKWIVDPLKRPACVGDSVPTEQEGISFDRCDEDDYTEIKKGKKQYVISDFNESGYSIIRSDWGLPAADSTYLFFMGMYHSKVHKHRDCLSLEWFDKGEKILCDSGKYGYRSDKYRRYFLSNKAHNTVEIEGFDILKIKPYGSSIVGSAYEDEVFSIEGRLLYPAIDYSRKVFLNPGKWLIVCDDLEFKKARNATQWFHLDPAYKLVSSKDNLLRFNASGNKKLLVHCLSQNTSSSLYRGDDDGMQGYICEQELSYKAAYTIGYNFFGDEKKLVTILALSDKGYCSAIEFVKYRELIELASPEYFEIARKQVILNGFRHQIYSDFDNMEVVSGKSTYEVSIDDASFEFYLDYKDSEKLVIMLPGATNRAKSIKNFQRHAWSDDFGCSVVSFLDSTVHEYNDLDIGWFQGKKDNYLIPKLLNAISKLIQKLNVHEKDVLLFGSSAGGFAALKLANHFSRSTVVVINPQIYLKNYTRLHFEKLLNYSYEGISEAEVIGSYGDRISVDVDLEKRVAPILYYQNTFDRQHSEKQLKPFLEKIQNGLSNGLVNDTGLFNTSKPFKLHIIYYSDEANAHSPPDKNTTMKMIAQGFNI